MMGLFDTSVITNATRNNAKATTNSAALLNNTKTASSSDLANAKSTSMAGIASTAASIPAAISDGVTTTVKGVSSSFASKVDSVVSSATSELNSAVGSVESTISSMFDSVTGSLSSSYKSVTDSLFGDSSSNNTKASAVKTAVPDPVASSFANGTPKSTLFKTTSATTGLAPHTVTGAKTTTTDNSIQGSLSVLTQRYGTDLIGHSVSSAKSYVSNLVKSSGIQSLYGGIKSVVGTAGSVYSSVQSDINAVGSTLSGIYQGGLAEYRSLVGGLATDLTGNVLGMDGLYNSSLPAVTDLNGNPIPGVPTGTSASSLTSLFSTAKSLGCSVGNIDLTAYSATQSIYGALLGIAAQTNLTSLLQNLLNCNRFDNYGANIAKTLFYQNAGSQVNVAHTLLTSLGGSRVASTPALSKSIVTNPNLTTADSGTVNSMLSTLGTTADAAYSTGSTIGADTLWDTRTLSAANTRVTKSILSTANSDVAYLTGGREIAHSFFN